MKIVFRSFFKNGKNNLIKILSLSVGMALSLVLIANVYFQQSYNDFFPDNGRIYTIISNYKMGNDDEGSFPQTSGGVAVGMKEDIPEIEAATRYTWLFSGKVRTPDKQLYEVKAILADSCLFDVLPRPILTGNAKDILSRPMYALVSRTIAENMGGLSEAVGKTFESDSRPGRPITIGGVFEDLPKNSHLDYDVVISLKSISQFMGDGSLDWVGNDRYLSYVKLYPGVDPASLEPGIEKVKNTRLPLKDLEQAGVSIDWDFKPLLEIHAGDEGARRTMLIFAVLAFVLLFTAVMNYVLIVISSLVNRSKEMAVNKCYGASEKDIYLRMLSETFVDLFISVVIAVLLIFFFRGTILSLLGTGVGDLFTPKSVSLLAGVCVAVFFIAALLPGYLYARIPVAVAFRKFTESKRYWKLGLLFFQFIAAGFFVTLLVIVVRQYHFMVNFDPGYRYENVAYVSLSGVNSELRQKALDETRRLSGVAGVSSCDQVLFGGASGNNIYLPGDNRELFNVADLYASGNGYLQLMGIPVIEGRTFTENVPSSREIMVSRSFVEKMKNYADWKDGAVGKTILVSEHSQEPVDLFTICGVFDDILVGVLSYKDPRPAILFYSDRPANNLIIQFHRETPEAMKEAEDKLREVMPDKDINIYSYAGEMVNRYSEVKKYQDSILIGGIVTLLICLIGLIGYTNDEMNRRRKETAIRKVNGATILDIERLFLKEINWMALPAITLGCMAAYFLAERVLDNLADKISLNLFLFAACGLLVLLIVLAAVAVNCYRAAIENPAISVKTE